MATKQHGAGSLLTTNDEAIVALSVSKGEKQLFPGLPWERGKEKHPEKESHSTFEEHELPHLKEVYEVGRHHTSSVPHTSLQNQLNS